MEVMIIIGVLILFLLFRFFFWRVDFISPILKFLLDGFDKFINSEFYRIKLGIRNITLWINRIIKVINKRVFSNTNTFSESENNDKENSNGFSDNEIAIYRDYEKTIFEFYNSVIDELNNSIKETEIRINQREDFTIYILHSLSNKPFIELVNLYIHFDIKNISFYKVNKKIKSVNLKTLPNHQYFLENINYKKEVYSHLKRINRDLNNYNIQNETSDLWNLFSLSKNLLNIDLKYDKRSISKLNRNDLDKIESKKHLLKQIKKYLIHTFRGEFNSIKNLQVKYDTNSITHYDYSLKLITNIFINIKGKRKTGDVIGIGFNSINSYIKNMINPVFGWVKNIGDKKHYFYLSLGEPNSLISNILLSENSVNLTKSYYLNWDYLGLNVGYDKSSYLLYIFHDSNTIKRGDSLIFRDLESQLKFMISEPSVIYDGFLQIEEIDEGNVLDDRFSFTPIRVELSDLKEIERMETFELYHYSTKDENVYPLYSDNYHLNRNTSNHEFKDEISNQIFIEMIKNLPFKDSFEVYDDYGKNEVVYVYVMKDNNSGFYKIGISNNPNFREKTLLSQTPSIETLYKRGFENRELSKIMEKTLHEFFNSKRVRGEWFDLNENDLLQLKSLLGI